MKARLLAISIGFTLQLSAADWLQFRGPNGTGVAAESEGLPTSLAEKNIAWKIALPGRGLSCPIIVGDRVFVTGSSGPQQERLHVLCLNAADGSVRWERQFWATGRTMCHPKTSVAASSPTSDGRRVYAIFSSNDIVCLDLDGNLVWLRGITRDYPNVSNSLGMAASPMVVGGTLVAQVESDSESYAIGIDAGTGVNRWRIERPKSANWTSPVTLTSPSGPILALQSSKGIQAIEPVSGRTLWTYTDGAATIASSATADGILYVPSHGMTALQPSGGDGAPSQLWRSNQLSPGTGSPLVFGGRIYTVNAAGVLNCGDIKDGKRLWQLRLKGPFSASPIAAGKYIYCVSEEGLLQVVDTSAPEGSIVGQLELGAGEVILGTPAISAGAIYVRSNGKLWKLKR
ncbi:MAG: pyrrolo-quinoline quinone [Pedosphaera sp.]|nr:pyrrolo-quinoline quinone [Pedosphaera sp.]